ncbi:hypothetical protein N9104_02685 [Pseudomonadales bacterium]|nr:hypothetical protein [Pseudomonadales bacterium]
MALLAQQFSANVAPLISRSKYIRPLHRQGFFVFGTAVLSECGARSLLPRNKASALPTFFVSQRLSASKILINLADKVGG